MGWVGVSVLVRWLLGWLLALHLRPLPQGSLRRRPRLSVLIPARNEAATLPHLLAALAGQTLQPLEVIVIDDHSSDATAAIARAAAATLPLRVLQPPPLAPGWCGKTWALHHGVKASCGIHEWRPSPCREFGLRAPHGLGDDACARARQRHGLPALQG